MGLLLLYPQFCRCPGRSDEEEYKIKYEDIEEVILHFDELRNGR